MKSLSKRKYRKYISSTIGHCGFKIQFYSVAEGVLLVPVSAYNLEVITKIKQVVVSSEEFNNRSDNETEEYNWACKKLGVFEGNGIYSFENSEDNCLYYN